VWIITLGDHLNGATPSRFAKNWEGVIYDKSTNMMFESTGVLQYTTYPEYRLVALVDQGITDFYRSLIPKWELVNRPRWPAHITIVRPGYEEPINLEPWGKHEGESLQFFYDSHIHKGEAYYWLNIWSVRLEEIRRELGLPVENKFTIPPKGFSKTFHCTIGNLKID